MQAFIRKTTLQLFVVGCGFFCAAELAWTQEAKGSKVNWGRDLISSVGTDATLLNGININQFLGADRFYNSGYTGSNAILANIEAGHARDAHDVLTHITEQVTGTGATGDESGHASAATHAMSGRLAAGSYPTDYYGYGIGYGAETWTGAIATAINGDGSFEITNASLASTYTSILQTGVNGRTADVFNNSWTFPDPTGFNDITLGIDGLINFNRKVGVVAAGNSGEDGSNSVGGLAAGYNSITVGAMGTTLASDPYGTVSAFSSYGPSDFYDAATSSVITGVRSTVDLTAPGEQLMLVYDLPGLDNVYLPVDGTSFSSPLVAGGAGLVVDAGNQLYGTADAIDGRVVKSILLNSADKTSGWDNGQFDDSGVIRTTQSLDYRLGAGRMNLASAFDQYVLTSDGGLAGTADVGGLANGDLGNVDAIGWDFGDVVATAGSGNLYFIERQLLGGSEFQATLTWFADRLTGSLADFNGADEDHLANLDLIIFEFDNLNDRNIIGTYAVSDSLYNMTEHLSFLLPKTGYYGLQVRYTEAHWDFGAAESSEQYGIAWSGVVAVPEVEATGLLVFLSVTIWISCVRRKRAKLQLVNS